MESIFPFAELERVYPEKFDAVICMEYALCRFPGGTGINEAIRAMLERLNEGSVIILHTVDQQELVYGPEETRDYAVIPILLDEECRWKRYSVVRTMRFLEGEAQEETTHIYYMTDRTTGATQVDWERVSYYLIFGDDMHGYVYDAGGFVHEVIEIGEERLFVCRTEPQDE